MKNANLVFILVAILFFATTVLKGQVAINTDGTSPNASAMLDVKSTVKGFLLPRLTTAQRITLGSIATAGLVVYDTDLKKLCFHDGTGWSDVSTGNLWSHSGTNTYVTNTGDNVGIGYTNPNYKLSVGGQLGLLETGGSPTYFTVFQSGDLTTNRTFTFPADYGTSGYSLISDGAGTLSWTSRELPLTFSNGLTRATNTVKLGGALTENTTITQSAAQALTFTNGGTANVTFNLTSTGDFDIQHAGTSALFVNSSGRVGIGTNNPGYTAEFIANTGDLAATPVLRVENTSTTSTAAKTIGILSQINSTSPSGSPGIALFGYSASPTGAGIGVWGETSGATGRGVYGWADHTSGVNYAVYGQTNSSNGYAGYFTGGKNYFQGNVGMGSATDPDYPLHVIANQSTTSSAIAYVENTYSGTTGWIYGIQGRVNSTSPSGTPSIGVLGLSNAATGGSAGVMGQSNGATGIGVRAIALGSGANYALYAATASSTGWSGYFLGDKNYFEGSVGIGTNAPDEELVVGLPMGKGWSVPALTVSNATGGVIDIGSPVNHIAIDHGSAYSRARIISSDASGFGLGNIEFLVDRIGIGQSSPGAKLDVENTGNVKTGYFKGSSSGLTYPTLMSENTGTSGVAAYFKSYGTDATMVLGQDATATGPLFKGFGGNGGEEEISIANDGEIIIYNTAHNATIRLDPNYGGTTKGRVITSELEITGGADIAEPFVITESDNLQPGMVLSIDPKNPGKLKISDKAYDRCVAGIVSGARDIQPGLILRQKGTITDGQHLVALTGRVYCLVDATENPINPGDLLTTSNTAGYAMKVMDNNLSQGAIIGKAMTALENSKGLVLVLVSLQ